MLHVSRPARRSSRAVALAGAVLLALVTGAAVAAVAVRFVRNRVLPSLASATRPVRAIAG